MTRPPQDTLVVRAPAKINLHLGVGAAREDGFHPLDTVYQAISLYDDLTVRAAPEGEVQPGLTMQAADHVDLSPVLASENIALAALRLLEQIVGPAGG